MIKLTFDLSLNDKTRMMIVVTLRAARSGRNIRNGRDRVCGVTIRTRTSSTRRPRETTRLRLCLKLPLRVSVMANR